MPILATTAERMLGKRDMQGIKPIGAGYGRVYMRPLNTVTLFRYKGSKKRYTILILTPGGDQEIEIVIQDRMFTQQYELTMPKEGDSECEGGSLPDIDVDCDASLPNPSIVAEFFGDHIVVNGKVWPVLEVGAGYYRFRLLNGSDSRFYALQLRDHNTDGAISDGGLNRMWVIGSDNGFLEHPVVPKSGGNDNTLLIGPGERYDVVVDFTGLTSDDKIYMRNFGPDDPFKGFSLDGSVIGGSADIHTTGQVMEFRVKGEIGVSELAEDFNSSTDLRPLLPAIPNLAAHDADNTRGLVLFEGFDNFGRLQPLLGTIEDGTLTWADAITENPKLNDTEVWEIYNTTEDAHPIHLHLVTFKIINREDFNYNLRPVPLIQHNSTIGQGAIAEVTALAGNETGPEAWENGWKDTVVMNPGQVTRIIANFDRRGRYVWHCHILSHEDHEMMRPFHVGPLPKRPSSSKPGPPK
jgi:spore coat protein A, manganese oxidase